MGWLLDWYKSRRLNRAKEAAEKVALKARKTRPFDARVDLNSNGVIDPEELDVFKRNRNKR